MSKTSHSSRRVAVFKVCLAAVAAALSVACVAQTSPGSSAATDLVPMTLVELHWLNPGATAAQANEYIDRTEPIAQRHQGKILDVYRVAGTVKGSLDPAFIWIYQFKDRSAMPGLSEDVAYKANVPLRNATWDFSKNQVFAVRGILSAEGQLKARAGWMNFVELHWASDERAAEDDIRWVAPVAKRHGAEIAQVFKVEAAMKGNVQPQYIWIYRFPNEQAMNSLMADPEYAAKIPTRNKIWDFDRNQLFAVTPRAQQSN